MPAGGSPAIHRALPALIDPGSMTKRARGRLPDTGLPSRLLSQVSGTLQSALRTGG